MKKNKLGTSDLHVTDICLGTMNWGQQCDEKEAHAQLSYAIDERGVNFIDTAEAYPIPPDPKLQGTTETFTGNWLGAPENASKRSDIILATKVCNAPFVSSRPTGAHQKLDRASIREAIEGSLTRLQTDYIDLYQVHWPERATNFFHKRGYEHPEADHSTPIEETLEALGELVKEGKVRHIGVSNETPWGIGEYLRLAKEKGLPRIISNQTHYNLLNRTFEIGLAEQAIKEDVPLLSYSVLSGGALSGKYLNGQKPEGARFTVTDRNSARNNGECLQGAIGRYVEIAKKHDLDPAQMALAFSVSRPFMGSTIIGATSHDQLVACIDASDVTLSQDVLDDIATVYSDIPDPSC